MQCPKCGANFGTREAKPALDEEALMKAIDGARPHGIRTLADLIGGEGVEAILLAVLAELKRQGVVR